MHGTIRETVGGTGMKASTSIGLVIVALIVAVPLASVAGCSAEDIVRVRTPPAVQSTFDQPASMTYREATQQKQIVAETTRTALAQWDGNIEDASRWVSLVAGLSGAAYEQFGPSIAAAAGIGGPLLTFLVGWLGLRKPNTIDSDQLTAEKIDSYNKGKKEAERMLARGAAS